MEESLLCTFHFFSQFSFLRLIQLFLNPLHKLYLLDQLISLLVLIQLFRKFYFFILLTCVHSRNTPMMLFLEIMSHMLIL